MEFETEDDAMLNNLTVIIQNERVLAEKDLRLHIIHRDWGFFHTADFYKDLEVMIRNSDKFLQKLSEYRHLSNALEL